MIGLERAGRGLAWPALLCVLALWGCGEPADGRVTIDFWAMGREGEVVQELTREFERLHPEIEVRVQQIPWSAAHEKLLTAFAGDSMPDVFQLGNTWIPEFVALDAVLPLDERLAAAPGLARDDFFAGIVATNEIDGRLYGVPWYVDTRLLFYRTDILEQAGYSEPPRSWAEWQDAMARVDAAAGPEGDAIILPNNEWATIVILALQQGATLLQGDAECGDFQAPAFRRALALYLSIFENGFASAAASAQIANLYQEFARGRFSMYISGPWNLGEFARRLPAALQDDWATAPMPAPDGSYPGISLAGGASLAIHRGSEHQAAAWELIRFLAGTRQQVRFYELSGNLPARTAAWEDEGLVDDPRAQAFFKQLEHLRSTPKIPEWERIATAITRRVEQVVRGDLTPEAALAALDVEVDAILEKRRWLLGRAQPGGASADPARDCARAPTA
jgi:multiple sugar transport system substrate-binding protein